MQGHKYQSTDEYIDMQEETLQPILKQIRTILAKTIPEAQEVISYNMPAIKFKKVLVYYAVTKKHLGFYPTSSGTAAFAEELAPYNPSKGTVRFPLDQPLPVDLIIAITKFRYEEVLAS